MNIIPVHETNIQSGTNSVLLECMRSQTESIRRVQFLKLLNSHIIYLAGKRARKW